jgi:hypothetical protein
LSLRVSADIALAPPPHYDPLNVMAEIVRLSPAMS